MAYQNPTLMFLHAGRDAGASAITVTDEASGFPKARLIDDRQKALFKFNTSAANHTIDIDRGAEGLEGIDRLLIPTGHNLSGATVTIQADTVSNFATPTALGSGAVPAGLILFGFGTNTERYLRVKIETSGQWELGEVIWTHTRAVTLGVVHRFSDRPEPNFAETTLKGAETFRQIDGPTQRRIVLEWARVSGSDLAIFDDLVSTTQAGALKFWIDGPDDSLPIVQVRAADGIPRTNDSPIPLSEITERISLDLLEAIE